MRSSKAPDEPNVPRLLHAHKLLREHPDLALQEFRSLAEAGSLSALVHLGRIYQEGANPETALNWYQQAADRGLLAGYYYLGRLYLKLGQHDQALASFRHAAAAEYAPASHWLGRMYFFGAGVPKDLKKSRSYLERATKGGNLFAKILLAKLLIQNPVWFGERIKGLCFAVDRYC